MSLPLRVLPREKQRDIFIAQHLVNSLSVGKNSLFLVGTLPLQIVTAPIGLTMTAAAGPLSISLRCFVAGWLCCRRGGFIDGRDVGSLRTGGF